MRSVRQAPSQAAFDAIDIPSSGFAGFAASTLSWTRLAKAAYPSQFSASPGSRLTPISRSFPCVYLAENEETAVAEVWGDRFFAHRRAGHHIYSIAETEAAAWGFFRIDTLPSLNLCDLTDATTRLATGLDSATLYDADLKIPQSWAEVIARHPRGFDGILYRSRHTDVLCIAAWNRPARVLEKELVFQPAGSFLNCVPSYAVAKTMGLALAFPR